jgi:hypothetical protein
MAQVLQRSVAWNELAMLKINELVEANNALLARVEALEAANTTP